jgi:hypothetical protein
MVCGGKGDTFTWLGTALCVGRALVFCLDDCSVQKSILLLSEEAEDVLGVVLADGPT